ERRRDGLVHRRLRHVADRHPSTGGGELAGELAAHAGAAAGDDGDEPGEVDDRRWRVGGAHATGGRVHSSPVSWRWSSVGAPVRRTTSIVPGKPCSSISPYGSA